MALINNEQNGLCNLFYSYYFLLFLLFLCDFSSLVCDVQSLSVYLNLLFVTVVEIHTLILDVCVYLNMFFFFFQNSV